MRRGLIVALLVAELVGAVIAIVTLPRAATATPGHLLIGFPLDRIPVPGWRLTAADIGLPADVPVGQPITTIGDHAYFVTGCAGDCKQGWVYGVDLKTGARLYRPAPIDGFRYDPLRHACRQNGPSVAVCVNNEFPEAGRPGRVWVVDLDRGAVTHSGNTDLWQDSVPGPGPALQSVGNPRGQTRLVASVRGKGVYGVGPRGELTWFVPGSGQLVAPGFAADDGLPVTLATQIPTAEDPRFRVFSVVDGTERTPTPPAGATLRRAIVYAGGFAYQYEVGDKVGVLFYDPAGHPLTRRELKGYNLMENTSVPVVLDGPVFRVYAPSGKEVATLPAAFADHAAPIFWALGDNLYLSSEPTQGWQPWSLDTGRPGPTCQRPGGLTSYRGSDGRVIVLGAQDFAPAPEIAAVDLTTCQIRWRITEPDQHHIEQLGTALVDRGPAELVLLRKP